MRRWLHGAAIKPWRYRSWIFPREPDFAAKAARVLDLYGRVLDGVPLGVDDYVISADEKSQLQALARCHPELAPGPGRVRRVEFEYERGGTLAYMGAYDVHRAHLIGHVAAKTGIVSFTELVDKVMTCEPYASARTVDWIVDNGSSHNGQRSIDRMNTAWPNARLVHLPVHASWLNQPSGRLASCNRGGPADTEDGTNHESERNCQHGDGQDAENGLGERVDVAQAHGFRRRAQLAVEERKREPQQDVKD